MSKILAQVNRLTLFYLCGLALFLISQMPTYAQQGSYSTMAQRILDNNNSEAEPSNLDVFKFSINDIINSSGSTVDNAYGEPTIFGRTDYGSEFTLSNDLSNSFSIEIPAFVIDNLAETSAGEYFPVIKNGNNDAEDGTYINTFTDDALGTQVTEYFNSGAPDKIETNYDYGTTEIEYLSEDGIDVKDHIYEDGSVYKSFFIDDELAVLASTYEGIDGYTSTSYSDSGSNYNFFTSLNTDGSTYNSYSDGNNSGFSENLSAAETQIDSNYYEDGLSLSTQTNDDGSQETTYYAYDDLGNYNNIVEFKDETGEVTSLQYSDQDNPTAVELFLVSSSDDGDSVTLTYTSNVEPVTLVKTQTSEDITISYNDVEIFSFLEENKNNLLDFATDVIIAGENVVAEGEITVSEANNATNPNSLAIDFKDLYDSENGLAITPEMGYVKLNGGDGNEYINLSNGDIIEFFVRPTDTYLTNHNSEDLFFIDRPVPEDPVIAERDNSEREYTIAENSPLETEIPIYVGPGEEAVTLPSGETKVYVTTVHVPAPASRFLPSQVVMPIKADGDYNYDIEPAAAETFPDEVEVVAITEEEAEVISKKVKEIKKAKDAPSNPKQDEDNPPALDPGIEAMIKLNIFTKNVQKAPITLLSEMKKNIQKEFPNISDEFVNLMLNMANSNEKFDMMRDPKAFIEKEFSRFSNPEDFNSILDDDLSQQELTKIINIIQYSFSLKLAELGFETLENQEVEYSNNVASPDKIVQQFQLQNDLLPVLSLLGTENNSQSLETLLRDPLKKKPDSSEALFNSSQNQKILGNMKNFSEAINLINNGPSVIRASEDFINNDIPVIEVNVGVGENIAEALKEKLAEDKRLNINFQPRELSSKLQKYNFELPPQSEILAAPASPPLLAEALNITDQEIQLVTETTEATNNILDETVAKMLKELGEETPDKNMAQLAAGTTNISPLDQQEPETSETVVFSNALSTVQRLQKIEDIRAIFQILGLGS